MRINSKFLKILGKEVSKIIKKAIFGTRFNGCRDRKRNYDGLKGKSASRTREG